MAKIVKDIDEAKAKGYIGEKPSPQASENQVLNIVKEINSAIQGLKELKGIQPEKPETIADGRDFITSSSQELNQDPINKTGDYETFDSKKKESPIKVEMKTEDIKPVALTLSTKKIEEQLDMMMEKEIPAPYNEWTMKDIKENWKLVKMFVIPKLIDGIKYAIEIKEVEKK